MRRRATLRKIPRQALIGFSLAFAVLGGLSCGGRPCGSRVVIINRVPGDSGLDCSVCGYPVISCNLVTVNSGYQRGTAVSCNIANECP